MAYTSQTSYYSSIIGLVFLLLVFFFYNNSNGFFGDSDVFWHLASGDLIRQLGHVPQKDVWSYTAGDTAWLNNSWLWQVGFSFLYEKLGWHGVIAIHSGFLGVVFTALFGLGLQRSNSVLAAIIAVFVIFPLSSILMRPLHVTNLMVVIWLWILGMALRGECRVKWLALLPFTMLIWVNCHGGYLFAFPVLGIFFLQAISDRQYFLAKALFACGIATLLATLCNPYGIYIYEAAWRPMTDPGREFITEWKPYTFVWNDPASALYIVAFIYFLATKKTKLLQAEIYLAVIWLFLGLLTIRHMMIFAFVSAPLMAVFISQDNAMLSCKAVWLNRIESFLSRGLSGSLIGLVALFTVIILPTSLGSQIIGEKKPVLVNIKQDLEYLQTYYPGEKILNSYNIGSHILFSTRGKVPVFIDPRTTTAYPKVVVEDFKNFLLKRNDGTDIFEKYDVSVLLLSPNSEAFLIERFKESRFWEFVYSSENIAIFARKKTPA